MSESENPDNKNKTVQDNKKCAYKIPKIDEYKNTELHHAAATGDKNEVIRCLQSEDVVIDAENFMGWTPLMMACRKGFKDIAVLLLENKADASRKNKFGCNVFLITVASGEIELVTLILKHTLRGGISRQSLQSHFSPLSLAVLFQRQDVLDFLLTQYFNVDIVTAKTGITPLMFAAAMENTEAYKKLVNHGADINIKNALAHTAQDITTLRTQLKLAYSDCSSPVLEKLVRSPQIYINSIGQQHPLSAGYMSPIIMPHPAQGFFQSHLASPFFLLSPQSNFHPSQIRRSSNTSANGDIPGPPNVTPITPIPQQMFFPPGFSPQHFVSPVISNENENLLNLRMDYSSMLNYSNAYLSVPSPNY